MKYHLIGIAGSMMSGLAEILRARGHQVSGSDLATTGHDPSNVGADVDRVVYTPAAREGSPAWPELEAARIRGVDTLRLDEMLGELTKGKTLLAVTGAHGKSSTTAMLGHILVETGHNPTVLLGAPVPAWKGCNYRVGDDAVWVLEADDYDHKFLALHPTIALVTNIDAEHLDVYGSYEAIEAAFTQFVTQIQPGGQLVASADVALNPIVAAASVSVHRYGAGTDSTADHLPRLHVIGAHQYLNAAGAVLAAVCYGIDRDEAAYALTSFTGTGRRLEFVGERSGVRVYDDYGHHPNELRPTIRGLRDAEPGRRLVVAFQPHQHSRVVALFDDFAASFADVDKLLLVETWAVPGRNEGVQADTKALADAIAAAGVDVEYVATLEELETRLDAELKSGDVFLTMGATEITKVGRNWIDSSQ